MDISFVIPVYNEEGILRENTKRLHSFLSHHPLVQHFEILLCDNGSTDQSHADAQKLAEKFSNLRVLSVPGPALGKALRSGILESKYELFFIEGMDLPFGTQSIDITLRTQLNGFDIILRSKSHPSSIVHTSLKRTLFTKSYNTLLRLLFHTTISDMHAGGIFSKRIVEKYIKHIQDPGPFFQTQLVLYARFFTDRICEIPVSYLNPRGDSRMNIGHASLVLKSLLRELPRYQTFIKEKKPL